MFQGFTSLFMSLDIIDCHCLNSNIDQNPLVQMEHGTDFESKVTTDTVGLVQDLNPVSKIVTDKVQDLNMKQ